MRRLLCYCLPLVVLAIVSTGTAQDKPIAQPYYPLKVGDQWTYRAGKDTLVIRVEREVPLEFTRDGKDAKREKAIGFILKEREAMETVAVLNDGVYRFSTAGKPITPPLRFFKFPVKADESWTIECKTTDGKAIRGKFVAGRDTIQLALEGRTVELPTVTVTSKDFTVDDTPMSIKYWFAENIGLVKQQVQIGKNTAVTMELRAFKPAQ